MVVFGFFSLALNCTRFSGTVDIICIFIFSLLYVFFCYCGYEKKKYRTSFRVYGCAVCCVLDREEHFKNMNIQNGPYYPTLYPPSCSIV